MLATDVSGTVDGVCKIECELVAERDKGCG